MGNLLRAAVAFATLLCVGSAHALSSSVGNDLRVEGSVKSYKDMRDANLVRQAYDYSCGAAALATLLTYGFEDPMSELEVLVDVFETLTDDEESVRKMDGLSLLDMQRVAQARGYRAQGFRLEARYLPELTGPVIVFIRPRGYEHFAVLRGIRGNRFYLADPALGNTRLPDYRFRDMWLDEDGKGVIFVVEPANGGLPADYPLELEVSGPSQPELLTVRQLMRVGGATTMTQPGF